MPISLKTKYIEGMDRTCPHNYYPRPQLKRNSFLCLNGEWELRLIKAGKEVKKKILVPFCPESMLSGVEMSMLGYDKTLYEKNFLIPKEFIKDRVILHFGAVDQTCAVYINGRLAGENEGGYLPFSFDITDLLFDGENSLLVDFKDELDIRYPYGKQTRKRGGMWYTPVSGIWQSVWLESVPKNYIEKIKIEPLRDGVMIAVSGGEAKKTLSIKDGETYVFEGESITVRPENPKYWSPEEPNLYYFTLTSGSDRIESYFAIRWIDTQEIEGIQRLCLNGKPYIFNGLLDQGYFPDGLFLPATVDGYIDDIRLAKSMGFNMLRKHIKVEPMIYYYLCDVEGIAVFQDMVNNGKYSFIFDTALPTIGLKKMSDKNRHKSKAARAMFEKTMYGICDLLYNSPSVIYYTIFNEGWGQFSADEMFEKLKGRDTTRIIDATSGWFRQTKSDVDSRHIYFKELSVKDGDSRPLVISEFGGYSYRVSGHLFGEKNYGYKNFETQEQFEEAVYALYEKQALPLIKRGACALVYTQVSDVEDETNGIVTYDREIVKLDPTKFSILMEKIKQI